MYLFDEVKIQNVFKTLILKEINFWKISLIACFLVNSGGILRIFAI